MTSDIETRLRREIVELRRELSEARSALLAAAQPRPASASDDAELITELRRELDSGRTLLRAVFDGSPDALLLADNDGFYVEANPAACELFGKAREELVGSRAPDFAASGYDAAEKFADFLETGRMSGQFPMQAADGTARVLEFNAQANVVPGLHLSALRDVTDRVAAEVALRRSEVRFRAMVEKGNDGITLLSGDVRTLYQSPAVERLVGYALHEAQGMSWQDFVDESERPKLASALAKLMEAKGTSVNLEFRIRRRDASHVWVDLTATNWLDDPDIAAIVVNFRDITERKRFEEERAGFFDLSTDLLCIAGTDGSFRSLNAAWEATLGWSAEELCARPWLDFVHPDDVAATEREGARLSEGRVVVRFENRYRCRDGTYRWLQWAAIPTAEGQIYACAHDVTVERASAERHHLLFTANPLAMVLADAATLRLLDVNDACVRAYAYAREDLLARSLSDLVVAERRDAMRELALHPADTWVSDRRHVTALGEERRVQVSSHRLAVDGRDAILEVFVDVTEAEQMQEDRARHVERLRLLELSVSRLNDIVLITKASPLDDPGPEIVYVNEAFERVTGFSREEAIGRTPRMLQGPDTDRATLARLRSALGRAEPTREVMVNYRKDGTAYWLELDVAPVRDDAGELTHFVAIERDVSESHRAADALRQVEERLRQAQKMEAIGNLAGGIAHDFNNLLSVILSYTSMIMDDLPAGDPLRDDIDQISQAGHRATDMTRQLLAFSRKQILQPAVVDVSATLRGMERMLARILGEDVDLALLTSADAGQAFVDPSQLEQVVMNLVVNARDAMPNGGNLTIETSSAMLDASYVGAHPGVAPGSYVLLAVTDSGAGMDRATQERVFEPFFTTKEHGKGTGLGLSTVYGIVRQSGGHVWLYSEPGHGTTFKVYFPRTDRAAMAPSSVQRSEGESLRGSETVLLVEDDPPVRHVVSSILRKSGYHVLEAQNGGEAFLLCEQFRAAIHLLLTDVVMPRMSGRQLAERLTEMRPEMKVLYMSGYTENTIVHHGVLDAGVEFLAKPIMPHALLRKVRGVLGVRGARKPG